MNFNLLVTNQNIKNGRICSDSLVSGIQWLDSKNEILFNKISACELQFQL